jgi:hypothetical protein
MVCRPRTADDDVQSPVLVEFVLDDENHPVAIIDIRAGINFRVSALNAEIVPGNYKILNGC